MGRLSWLTEIGGRLRCLLLGHAWQTIRADDEGRDGPLDYELLCRRCGKRG